MTRPIEITLQFAIDADGLNLNLDSSGDELNQEVGNRLRKAFGDTLLESSQPIQWIAIHDSAAVISKYPNVNSLSMIPMTDAFYNVDYVSEVRPDLTYEQAIAVLSSLLDAHPKCYVYVDPSAYFCIGGSSDIVEYYAEMLYGAAPDAITSTI